MYKNIVSPAVSINFLFVVVVLAFLFPFAVQADQSIGEVQRIKGDVFASSFYGAKRQLGKNDLIYQGDIINTANGGEVFILFEDGSNFLISEDSEIVIDEMVYDQYTKEGRFISRLVRGTLLLVSGNLKNKENDVMRIKTNMTTIGIRGTKAFIQVEDDKERFVLLEPEKNEGNTSIHIASKWGSSVVDKINHESYIVPGEAPALQTPTNLSDIDSEFTILENPSRRKFAMESLREAGFLESLWNVVKERFK